MSETPGINSVQTNNGTSLKYNVCLLTTENATQLHLGQKVITGLRGSASHAVLTAATGLVNGRWQFSTPYRIDTPLPIAKKFVTGDYVGDPLQLCQFGAHPSTGCFCANG